MNKRIEEFSQNLPILVNANWINSMGMIRSLALEKIPSISITKDQLGLSLFSNQTFGLKCPDYTNNPEILADFLLDLRKRLTQPGIIMPTDDGTLETLISIDEQIKGHYKKTYPKAEVLDFILDKYNQYSSAKAAGVPVPYTIAPENISDLENWPRDLFPCVVKGRRGKKFYNMVGLQALLIDRPEALYELFSNLDPKLAIIQEFIPGEDNQIFAYRFYFSEEGRLLAKFITQKLIQTPRTFGVMRRGISNSNANIGDQSLRWLSEIGYTGLGQVEYKLDPRDGKYKMIELNARSWLSIFLATLSGVNFAAIMYYSSIGKELDSVTEQVDGIEWVSHVEEFLTVTGEILKRKFNLLEWIKNRPKGKDVIFGWKDPLPGLIAPIFAIHSFLKKRRKSRGRFQKRLT
jgi:predicted ATP-grasp superfamily ATP-dependent carboligase